MKNTRTTWRTFKEHKMNVKNAKNEGFLTNTYLEIHRNSSSKIFWSLCQSNWEASGVWIKFILESKIFSRRLNQRSILLQEDSILENCTYSYINTNIHLWNIVNCFIFKLEILCLQMHPTRLHEENEKKKMIDWKHIGL